MTETFVYLCSNESRGESINPFLVQVHLRRRVSTLTSKGLDKCSWTNVFFRTLDSTFRKTVSVHPF